MKQVARNLTDMWDGFLLGKRYLIHDRDPLFTEGTGQAEECLALPEFCRYIPLGADNRNGTIRQDALDGSLRLEFL